MIKNLLLLLFSVIVFNVNAQNNSASKTIRNVYLYTFENLTSQNQVDKLIADVKKISFISEAKVNCKWEKNNGELIFVYNEEITGSENSENPDISQIKYLIQENGLIPIECKKRLDK